MDTPHAAWNSSCNITTNQLIDEFIIKYTNQLNPLYVNEQIEQIIRMFIREKLENEEIVPFSTAGLNVVRSNYNYSIKMILNDQCEMLNLLIDVYVNELFIYTEKRITKKLIKAFIEKDKETIDIINQFIINDLTDTDIYTKLMLHLNDVKPRHLQYIH